VKQHFKFKKRIRNIIRKFIDCETYLKDDFDNEHMKWVYAGITSIEEHEKIKKYYFENKIYEIT